MSIDPRPELPAISFSLNPYQHLGRWIDERVQHPILAWVLKSLLKGLEDLWIDAKVQSTLDRAIEPLEPPEPSVTAPTFTSEPSEVEGLDIIQLSHTYDD